MKYRSGNRWLREVASSLPRLYSVLTSNHMGKHKYIPVLIQTQVIYIKTNYHIFSEIDFSPHSPFPFCLQYINCEIHLFFFFWSKLSALAGPTYNFPYFLETNSDTLRQSYWQTVILGTSEWGWEPDPSHRLQTGAEPAAARLCAGLSTTGEPGRYLRAAFVPTQTLGGVQGPNVFLLPFSLVSSVL